MTNNITIPLAVVEQALEDIRRAARVLGDLPSTNQEGTRTREAWDFLNESGDALSAALFAAAEPVSVPHPDDIAVDKFATAMKEKMAKQRAKGYGGWEGPDCSMEFLQERLFTHVAKGDPVDVGNFAMMLFNRGERTAYEDQWVFELTGNWPGVATSTSPVPAAPELNLTADEMAELCGGQLGASEPVQPVQHTVPDAAKPATQGEREKVIERLINEQGWHQKYGDPERTQFLQKVIALLSAGPARVEPLTNFVRNLAKAYTDEARGLLDETYRFASQSPRGRDNINAILQLLDDIDSALEPSKPVQGIEKDQAS